MSSNMSEHDLKKLKKAFLELDTDGDGQLSFEEIRKFCDSDHKLAKKIIALADTDGDGSISLEELAMCAIHKKLVSKEERLWNIFCDLDSNGDGLVSAQEIEDVLGKNEDVDAMIAEIDTDHNGYIDYDEFVRMWVWKDTEEEDIPQEILDIFDFIDNNGDRSVHKQEFLAKLNAAKRVPKKNREKFLSIFFKYAKEPDELTASEFFGFFETVKKLGGHMKANELLKNLKISIGY